MARVVPAVYVKSIGLFALAEILPVICHSSGHGATCFTKVDAIRTLSAFYLVDTRTFVEREGSRASTCIYINIYIYIHIYLHIYICIYI